MEQALDLTQEMTQSLEARRHHSKLRRKSDCNKHKHKSMRYIQTQQLCDLFVTYCIT